MTKTLQYELQTGREWQYGVYIRDRLAGHEGPDPQPGLALGEVPAHDPRGPRDRGLRRDEQHGAPGRRRGQPRGPGDRGQAPALPAPDRVLLPHGTGQRGPRRLRRHRQPDAPSRGRCAASTRPRSPTTSTATPTTWRPEPSTTGIPLFYGPDLELGRPGPARQRRHGLAVRRPRQPRHHPVLEPDLRAPAAVGHVGLRRLRGHQDVEAARLPRHQRRGRRRRTGGAAARRGVRPHGLHRGGSTAGSTRTTTRCRWPSTSPSARGSS